jgi:Flp pilus assembly protein TadG
MSKRMRCLRRRGDDGAAAVETALVMPVLLLVLFAILEYGLYFNDALGASQGTRASVRQGVVGNFSGAGASNMAKLQSMTKSSIGALTGPTYVRVVPPANWAQGEPLTVCAMVESNALSFLPLPNDGWIKQRIQMPIEQTSAASMGGTVSDTVPGQNWNWCS